MHLCFCNDFFRTSRSGPTTESHTELIQTTTSDVSTVPKQPTQPNEGVQGAQGVPTPSNLVNQVQQSFNPMPPHYGPSQLNYPPHPQQYHQPMAPPPHHYNSQPQYYSL